MHKLSATGKLVDKMILSQQGKRSHAKPHE